MSDDINSADSEKIINTADEIIKGEPIYIVEIGTILTRDEEEYISYLAYHSNWSLYNDNLLAFTSLKKAQNYVEEYVQEGQKFDMRYCVVSKYYLDEYDEEAVQELLDEIENYGWSDDIEPTYEKSDVVYSKANINGNIVEDFLNLPPIFH